MLCSTSTNYAFVYYHCFDQKCSSAHWDHPSQWAPSCLRGVICISKTPVCLFIVLSQRPCANGSRGGLCCVGCSLHKTSACGTAHCRLEITDNSWSLHLYSSTDFTGETYIWNSLTGTLGSLQQPPSSSSSSLPSRTADAESSNDAAALLLTRWTLFPLLFLPVFTQKGGRLNPEWSSNRTRPGHTMARASRNERHVCASRMNGKRR